MITRRNFLKSSATLSAAPGIVSRLSSTGVASKNSVNIKPYKWEGPYAGYRAQQNALHDWRLCADVRANWLGPCERIILRTSEIIGHETGFLYDDHFPPSEPQGRGKDYHHIPFEWQTVKAGEELFTDCTVPKVGGFSIRLTAREDFLDIRLSVRNHMRQPMQNADWAFCAIGFEAPSIADSEDARTYLFDGERLRTLGDIAGRDMKIYKVTGANGFIPVGHRALPVGPVQAKASVVVIEGVDGAHSLALGFEKADHIYGDSKGNKCFHADPYFGPVINMEEERTLRGRLYMIEGSPQEAFRRYQQDFGGHQSQT